MDKSKVQYYKPEGLAGLEILTCPDVDYRFPLHFHHAYCIWINNSGGEHYTHRGNSYILQPDHFSIIAPGEVHANHACENKDRSLVTFYLAPEQLRRIGLQINDSGAGQVEFRTGLYQDDASRKGLSELSHLLRQSSSSLQRESAFLDVVARLLKNHGTETLRDRFVGAEKDRVGKIVEVFHARLAEDISLGELSECCDCTPFHLIRFFKKAIGLSPHAYLVQLRLEKAKSLLGDGFSIVDTALDTGFADQSHLTRHFKAKFGIPPGQYKRQIFNS
jgi:AraC-like DNA-binding protein